MNNDNISIEIVDNFSNDNNNNNMGNKSSNKKVVVLIVIIVLILAAIGVVFFFSSTKTTQKVLDNAITNTFKDEVRSLPYYLDTLYSDYRMGSKITNSEDICISESDSEVYICSTLKGLVDSGYVKKSNITDWSGYISMTINKSSKETIKYNISNGKLIARNGADDTVEVIESDKKISEKCTCNSNIAQNETIVFVISASEINLDQISLDDKLNVYVNDELIATDISIAKSVDSTGTVTKDITNIASIYLDVDDNLNSILMQAEKNGSKISVKNNN